MYLSFIDNKEKYADPVTVYTVGQNRQYKCLLSVVIIEQSVSDIDGRIECFSFTFRGNNSQITNYIVIYMSLL